MAATIRDLLDVLHAEVDVCMSPDRVADAVQAIGELGRAVDALAVDGLVDTPELRGVHGRGDVIFVAPRFRDSVTRHLVDACLAAAADAPGDHTRRLASLAGAVADSIVLLRDQLGRDQRWALVCSIARTARHLTVCIARSGSGSAPPEDLAWVSLAARAVGVREATDPPAPASGRTLDHAVPTTVLTADMAPERVAAEALITLTRRLAATNSGAGASLLDLFAASRAAESTAQHAVAVVAALTGRRVPMVHPAPAAWRSVRGHLQPFTAHAPIDPDRTGLAHWARLAHSGLRTAFGDPATLADRQPVTGVALDHLQRMANELPALADNLTAGVIRLADAGELHAFAHRLPFRDERLDQHLHHQAVVSDRSDLTDVTRAITAAGDHSAELTVALHHAHAGSHGQPGLIATHAERARTAEHHRQQPAVRWAALAACVDHGWSPTRTGRPWPSRCSASTPPAETSPPCSARSSPPGPFPSRTPLSASTIGSALSPEAARCNITRRQGRLPLPCRHGQSPRPARGCGRGPLGEQQIVARRHLTDRSAVSRRDKSDTTSR
jgi:hypothetical protein